MSRTVNTVFIDASTGEEIRELPSSFDREALRENLILSTHRGWEDKWVHYKVIRVEEQAGDTTVVQVKRLRRLYPSGLFFLVLGLVVVLALAGAAAVTYFFGWSFGF
jgi:hypothetical protein